MDSWKRDWNLGKSPTPLCCTQISLCLCPQPVLLLKGSLGLDIYYMMHLLSVPLCSEKKPTCKVLELQTNRKISVQQITQLLCNHVL